MSIIPYMNKDKYLRKKFAGNIIARIINRASAFVFSFAAAFCVFWISGMKLRLCLIAAAFAAGAVTIILVMVRRTKFCRFKERYMLGLKNKCLLEQLVMLSHDELSTALEPLFSERAGGSLKRVRDGYMSGDVLYYAFRNHPDNPVCVQQIAELGIMMKKLNAGRAVAAAMSTPDIAARTLSEKLRIEYIDRKELIKLSQSIGLTEESLDEALAAEARAERIEKSRLSAVMFHRGKIWAYIFCSALLSVWSFIAGFSLIYPIMACLCLVMAYISAKMPAPQEGQKL